MYNGAMLQILPRVVLVMAAVSFFLRVHIAQAFIRTPYHEFTLHVSGPDQNRFLAWAEGINRGVWSAPGTDPASVFQFSPVYPWLLSLSLRCFRDPFLAMFLFQSAMSVLAGWALWDCGRRLGRPAAGCAAAALWLFYAPSIFFDGCLIRESLLASTGLLTFWAALAAWERPGVIRAAAAGCMLGFCAAIRAHLFGPLLLLGWWAAAAARRDRRRLMCALIMTLTAAALNAPMAVRNYAVSGQFAPAVTQGADAFILGNDPEGPGIGHVPTANSARMLKESGGGFGGAAAVIAREFAAKPKAALELYQRKFRMLWNGHEVTANYSFHVWRFLLPPARMLPLTWQWILPPALIGVWFTIRRRPLRRWRSAAACAGVLLAGALVVHIQSRYRFVAAPFVILLAGLGIAEMGRLAVQKKWLALCLCALIAAGAAAAIRPDPSLGYYRVTGPDGVARRNTDPILESDYVTLLVSWALSGAKAHEEVIGVVSNQAARSYGPSAAAQSDGYIRMLTSERSALSRAYRKKYNIGTR